MNRSLSLIFGGMALILGFYLHAIDSGWLWLASFIYIALLVFAVLMVTVPEETPIDIQTGWKSWIRESVDLAGIIRREGLLQAEHYGKKLADPRLQKCFKWMSEGYEAQWIRDWIKSSRKEDEALAQQWQKWRDSVPSVLLVTAVSGMLFLMIQGDGKQHFIPLILGFFLLLIQMVVDQYFFSTQERARAEYWDLLENSFEGLVQGLSAQFLESQLYARAGIHP